MLRMSEVALPPHDLILLSLLGPLLTVAFAGLFGVYLSITRLRAQGSDTPIIVLQAPVVLVWSLFVYVMGEGFPRSVVLIFAVFAPVVMISSRQSSRRFWAIARFSFRSGEAFQRSLLALDPSRRNCLSVSGGETLTRS